MHKDKWIFYTDLFGSQRWERVDPAGLTVAESATDFPTLALALADASLYGYLPGEDEGATCALEWHRKPVVPFRALEKTLHRGDLETSSEKMAVGSTARSNTKEVVRWTRR